MNWLFPQKNEKSIAQSARKIVEDMHRHLEREKVRNIELEGIILKFEHLCTSSLENEVQRLEKRRLELLNELASIDESLVEKQGLLDATRGHIRDILLSQKESLSTSTSLPSIDTDITPYGNHAFSEQEAQQLEEKYMEELDLVHSCREADQGFLFIVHRNDVDAAVVYSIRQDPGNPMTCFLLENQGNGRSLRRDLLSSECYYWPEYIAPHSRDFPNISEISIPYRILDEVFHLRTQETKTTDASESNPKNRTLPATNASTYFPSSSSLSSSSSSSSSASTSSVSPLTSIAPFSSSLVKKRIAILMSHPSTYHSISSTNSIPSPSSTALQASSSNISSSTMSHSSLVTDSASSSSGMASTSSRSASLPTAVAVTASSTTTCSTSNKNNTASMDISVELDRNSCHEDRLQWSDFLDTSSYFPHVGQLICACEIPWIPGILIDLWNYQQFYWATTVIAGIEFCVLERILVSCAPEAWNQASSSKPSSSFFFSLRPSTRKNNPQLQHSQHQHQQQQHRAEREAPPEVLQVELFGRHPLYGYILSEIITPNDR